MSPADARSPVINLDQLQFSAIAGPESKAPDNYRGAMIAPISPRIGGQRLGYNLTRVPPGKTAFPAHSHYGNEEMFLVLAGSGELRVGGDTFPLRAGDVVACPAGGPETAHQIRNTSDSAELSYLAVSTMQSPDLVEYPDSGKLGAAHYLDRDESGFPRAVRLRQRVDNNLDYWDGE